MPVVDINCDMGESFGCYNLGYDREILDFITSANIACGFHAGDPVVIDRTVALAAEKGAGLGAHPSFPDLQGFGRRNMFLSKVELKAFLLYQIGCLKAFAEYHGSKLKHVKLHGALYNMAAVDSKLAQTAAECVAGIDAGLILVVLPGSEMEHAGNGKGLRTAREFFADRNYNGDGTLVSRLQPEALIADGQSALRRCIRAVKEGKVDTINGSVINLKIDTICLHGDSPSALQLARLLRNGLTEQGIAVAPMSSFL
jgi:UPF0271 protein